MMAITHDEVRRHPRWKEEQLTPADSPVGNRDSGAGLLGVVALLIVTAIAGLLILNG